MQTRQSFVDTNVKRCRPKKMKTKIYLQTIIATSITTTGRHASLFSVTRIWAKRGDARSTNASAKRCDVSSTDCATMRAYLSPPMTVMYHAPWRRGTCPSVAEARLRHHQLQLVAVDDFGGLLQVRRRGFQIGQRDLEETRLLHLFLLTRPGGATAGFFPSHYLEFARRHQTAPVHCPRHSAR